MAIFEKGAPRVISEKDEADLSKASVDGALSGVGYDDDGKFFYVTLDKVLFSGPAGTIKTVLEAHGFVPNIENVLACLDTLVFGVYARTAGKDASDAASRRVTAYAPCLRFELPHKSRIGEVLRAFYDELARHEAKVAADKRPAASPAADAKRVKDLKAEIAELKSANRELQEEVGELTLQLSRKQKSLSRASRALDSQRVLPDNVRVCRVERVDLKRRIVRVSSNRKAFDIPTHVLDRVPETQARCLAVFDEAEDVPVGIVFLDGGEAGSVDRRIAKLLHVEGDCFKARDSNRNELHVKAVNATEADTIRTLGRGMRVVVSVSDGYVVRFSVLGASPPWQFTSRVHEQFIVHDIGRNQLVAVGEEQAANGELGTGA